MTTQYRTVYMYTAMFSYELPRVSKKILKLLLIGDYLRPHDSV